MKNEKEKQEFIDINKIMDAKAEWDRELYYYYLGRNKYSDYFIQLEDRLRLINPKKRSIKIDNEVIRELILALEEYHGSHLFAKTNPFWNIGYNETILPYLDLSEFNFDLLPIIAYLNLKGHSEIVTESIAKKQNKEKALFHLVRSDHMNYNGVDLSGITYRKLKDPILVDFRNTGIQTNEICGEIRFANFENENLQSTFVHGIFSNSNFKNTGAKISFSSSPMVQCLSMSPSKALDYQKHAERAYNCNFTGCEVVDLTEGNLENLRRMKLLPFDGTSIEYDEKIYKGTEQIHKLVDNVIGDVLVGIHKKPKQRIKIK